MKSKLTILLISLIMALPAFSQECADCNKKLDECKTDLDRTIVNAKTIALRYEQVKHSIDMALKTNIKEYTDDQYITRLETALKKQKQKNTTKTVVIAAAVTVVTYFSTR